MNKADFIESVLKEITPAVYKKHKRKEILNSPELDQIVHREIKLKSVNLMREGERAKAEILLSFVKEKPRFALYTNRKQGEVFWMSLMSDEDETADYLLFEDETAQWRFEETWESLANKYEFQETKQVINN